MSVQENNIDHGLLSSCPINYLQWLSWTIPYILYLALTILTYQKPKQIFPSMEGQLTDSQKGKLGKALKNVKLGVLAEPLLSLPPPNLGHVIRSISF